MSIKIALAGNPNSGKTTLFNTLTGATQYVGNWPGVTVEKKEGRIRKNKDITVVDLPGIYSLSPYTLEEVIARNYLLNEKPDVIVNIVDTTNIERNLYLTTQLMELGIPVVVALNMMDVFIKSGDTIDSNNLKKLFNCEVVEISALKNRGTKDLVEAIRKSYEEKLIPNNVKFDDEIEQNIFKIMEIANVDRWTAIKLFENDEKITQESELDENIISKIENIRINLLKKENNDVESIIIDQRYNFVTSSLSLICVKANKDKRTISQKIDLIVTNRWLALPIFAVIIFAVYYLAISSVGGFFTDFINDTVFGPTGIPYFVEAFLTNINTASWLIGLIVDGIIGGVGAVLGFLPQMLVLFLLLGFLEDTGYMSRIAFILDKIFRKFGLSGKSFIPMLISTGCAVPGIMATRTIDNRSERRITMITTSFMPCSAKLPIIALISG
ncbi:MAG: ferrous iron transport protein B, partial [Bacilli bacterium]|nr:ferrous iron transport protein B [Bacilli bacterium]